MTAYAISCINLNLFPRLKVDGWCVWLSFVLSPDLGEDQQMRLSSWPSDCWNLSFTGRACIRSLEMAWPCFLASNWESPRVVKDQVRLVVMVNEREERTSHVVGCEATRVEGIDRIAKTSLPPIKHSCPKITQVTTRKGELPKFRVYHGENFANNIVCHQIVI